MKALLVLEDGTVFEGSSFGAAGKVFGEVVFNTSMTGYQEVLTDPSYRGQMVAMTYPLIGNYGINLADFESKKPWLAAFIVKECSRIFSNWRAKSSLPDFLKKYNIIGIEGIDTRALTKHIRSSGTLKAAVTTRDFNLPELVNEIRKSAGLAGVDLVREVTSAKKSIWSRQGKYKVAVLDCGVKFNILNRLAESGCRVGIYPALTGADEILKDRPDGVLLSNGPGDPAAVPYVVESVKNLIGKIPLFGICLGHQMLGQALGGKTYKLKFGHHGGNQPVLDLKTRKTLITVQNHGFCVDLETLPQKEIEITHLNLNDKTLEGMRHKKLPVFSVQFHPEAAPGPHDADYLFKEFIEMMKVFKNAKKKRP